MVSTSQQVVKAFTALMERGLLPDFVVRASIRQLLRGRVRAFEARSPSERAEANRRFLEHMRLSPVALAPNKANEQHYEVPATFFERVLGPRRKYSCCYYPAGATSLEQAEEHALALTCEHAQLRDRMKILELGCGWGSLTLWMAEHFPASRIMAVSNSHSQRAFIEKTCADRGLSNVQVITADMNDFVPPERGFDRVVSVEMFEHMRNWPELMRRIASWLAEDGALFVHVFCHRDSVYAFETENETDWMGREFFTGGIMPSYDLITHFQDDLVLKERWRIGGEHYQKTCEAWLANLDSGRSAILPLFLAVYGQKDAARWVQRWRIFVMACSELFGYNGGDEWWVGHYLLTRSPNPPDKRA